MSKFRWNDLVVPRPPQPVNLHRPWLVCDNGMTAPTGDWWEWTGLLLLRSSQDKDPQFQLVCTKDATLKLWATEDDFTFVNEPEPEPQMSADERARYVYDEESD